MYYDFGPYDYDDRDTLTRNRHMVARIQADGLCRVTYGEKAGLSYDELKARQPEKFQAFLPGNPTPDQYKLVNFSPYKVHQRCVDKMRVGRFLLAADAAHLCNPLYVGTTMGLRLELTRYSGGMGLTGGIADVGGLYDSLVGIHTGKADDSILDKYDEVRRRIWHDIINPISSENMTRLFKYSSPDEAMDKDPFFKMMKKMQEPTKGDEPPNPGLPSLLYDMTQHYKQ
ncbi:hypothetical protein NEMBOFW57_010675 [Staphylotrichum longicolle]|uniref:FAD-binding domain-containing protein n=1 Tax=Staphylotrichum longicolle TaxID=669026 RepID=A0AAD4ES03_9PEZI|nr:hypothetical protein NEMBOFW57_010675 [Staphylotrichum longicolle]